MPGRFKSGRLRRILELRTAFHPLPLRDLTVAPERYVSPAASTEERAPRNGGFGARAGIAHGGGSPHAERCGHRPHLAGRRGGRCVLARPRPEERHDQRRHWRAAGDRPPVGLGDDVVHPLWAHRLVAPAREPLRPAHDRRGVRELPLEPRVVDQRRRLHVRAGARPPASRPLPARVPCLPQRSPARALRALARGRGVRHGDRARAGSHDLRLFRSPQPARDHRERGRRPRPPPGCSSR